MLWQEAKCALIRVNAEVRLLKIFSMAYSPPELFWTLFKTDRGNYFPEKKRLIWLGHGYILIATANNGWHILNVLTQDQSLVGWTGEKPERLEQGDPIGDTEIVPDEQALVKINSCLTWAREDFPIGDPERVTVVQQRYEPAPPSTTMSYLSLSHLISIWALSWHAASIKRFQELPPNDDDIENPLSHVPDSWNFTIDGRSETHFISDARPISISGGETCGSAIFIFVHRWDCGYDVYRMMPV